MTYCYVLDLHQLSMHYKIITIFILLTLPLVSLNASASHSLKGIEVYLLPEENPIKMQLDTLFLEESPIENISTLRKAGFQLIIPSKKTHPIIARHPLFKGVIFKLYLEVQNIGKQLTETQMWLKRILGANKVRKIIDQKNWNDKFKVPKKWIYLFPHNSENSGNRRSILVEEEMDIFDDQGNKKMWKGDSVDQELLAMLHFILEEIGLRDCTKPGNIAFCRDGRIAFVDTQTWGEWPVSYHRLSNFLSSPMDVCWKEIIKNSKHQLKI